MVHSTFAQGHVMGGRDTFLPSSLGIPKSPSFHSGLDLVASASVDSLINLTKSPIDDQQYQQKQQYSNNLLQNNNMPMIEGDNKMSTQLINNKNLQNNENNYSKNGLLHVKNVDAVHTLLSMGHLPLLKGVLNILYHCIDVETTWSTWGGANSVF